MPLRKYKSAMPVLIGFSSLLNFDLMIFKALSHIREQPSKDAWEGEKMRAAFKSLRVTPLM